MSPDVPVPEPRRAACALFLVLLGGLAAAQSSEPEELERVLWNRDREVLHPDDPLALVGIEQQDNDFRARTPALVHAEREATRLDERELYERRRALYEGHVFSRPSAGAEPPSSRANRRRRAPGAPPVERGDSWMLTVCLVSLAAILGLYRLGSPPTSRGEG